MGKVNRKLKAKAKQAIAAIKAQNNSDLDYLSLEKDVLHKTKLEFKTITKKEKLREKHKSLINKFKEAAKKRKEEIARRNRERSTITGDLMPLKDSLPSLKELIEMSKDRDNIRTGVVEQSEEQQQPVKLSAKKKLAKKKEEFVSKVTSFENLLKDPDFKKNPREVISYHVKYTNGLIDN